MCKHICTLSKWVTKQTHTQTNWEEHWETLDCQIVSAFYMNERIIFFQHFLILLTSQILLPSQIQCSYLLTSMLPPWPHDLLLTFFFSLCSSWCSEMVSFENGPSLKSVEWSLRYETLVCKVAHTHKHKHVCTPTPTNTYMHAHTHKHIHACTHWSQQLKHNILRCWIPICHIF